ncbi:hypothetical protein PN498_00975 [Oscillatoria sp. CS-180]|uniref:hypothetical protein n=1 Tax=Oscillatoria sp. CS-180 TaxID=3021720 RepID=UPI00232EC931|nr:hypothetical protein [Oscillatoria sp. CS-180]MDB9524546.1 hypothetical protein [Oscillatoria sp. CS-180]
MTSPGTARSLTPELIRQLLDSDARAEMSSDYVRLMEIYCVVKAGGVAAQIAVARQLQDTEQSMLRQEINALVNQTEMSSRVRALRQEIQELEYSINSRVSYLQSINAQEETNVRSCISIIDNYFANLGNRSSTRHE